MLRPLLLVFVGGAVGGALRLTVGAALSAEGSVPWDLVLINVLGSAVLGFVVSRAEREGGWALFPAIGPGLLGGFTTFSGIAALTWTTDAPEPWAWALLGLLMAGAVAAAGVGWWFGSAEAVREEDVKESRSEGPRP